MAYDTYRSLRKDYTGNTEDTVSTMSLVDEEGSRFKTETRCSQQEYHIVFVIIPISL